MASCILSTTLGRSTEVVLISVAISVIRVITGLWRLSSRTEEKEDGNRFEALAVFAISTETECAF